jgi:DNA end-binding protein Ku
MAALKESVAKVRAGRGEDATVHEMPKKKTPAKKATKKTTAKKTAAKKSTKKAARKPRSA